MLGGETTTQETYNAIARRVGTKSPGSQYAYIDDMIAKMYAEPKQIVVPKEWAGITPYTPDEATTLLKAIRGLPGDQISAIMSKFEAERESSTQKEVK